MPNLTICKKSPLQLSFSYLWIAIGAFMAALSIEVFLYPNELIDGGIVGISLILGRLSYDKLIPLYLLVLNLPFVVLAYRFIRRTFVIQMSIALLLFAFFLLITEHLPPYYGEPLEVIVMGGAILGIGVGLIIRHGGCLDGSEILGIIANKKFGYTVGQVVLVFNFFVFIVYGLIFLNWHIAVQSLLTYIVAFKMIDLVIVGLEEIKQVVVISQRADEISKDVMEKLGLGLTVSRGQGGFTGEDQTILTIIVERLDIADLKEVVLEVDPGAFITISNIYEVVYGQKHVSSTQTFRSKKRRNNTKVW